jgi:hypothetical protein
MRHHPVRILAAALFAALTIAIIQASLNADWTAVFGSSGKRYALLGLVGLWTASAGAAFLTLVFRDLRQSRLDQAVEPYFERAALNDLMRHSGPPRADVSSDDRRLRELMRHARSSTDV